MMFPTPLAGESQPTGLQFAQGVGPRVGARRILPNEGTTACSMAVSRARASPRVAKIRGLGATA